MKTQVLVLVVIFYLLTAFMYTWSGRRYIKELQVIHQIDTIQILNIIHEQSQRAKKQENRCVPQRNIVFLKTHKTGSSTLANILNRYADENNLTVLLPKENHNRFLWPSKFTAASAEPRLLRNGNKANMIVNHARFHKISMDNVIAKPAKYITIIREPVSQFESLFFYEAFDKIMKIKSESRAMDIFLASPEHYYQRLWQRKKHRPGALPLLHNGMLFDLGLSAPPLSSNRRLVHAANIESARSQRSVDFAIRSIERDFDLVLLTEHFDESLVLLKKVLCWTFNDLVYFKQNVRTRRKPVSAKNAERIRHWNSGDLKLYKHFNETLWRKIREYGPVQFERDLTEFREKNRQITEQCSFTREKKSLYSSSTDVNKYKVRGDISLDPSCKWLCENMLLPEAEYILKFRDKYHLNSTKSQEDEDN